MDKAFATIDTLKNLKKNDSFENIEELKIMKSNTTHYRFLKSDIPPKLKSLECDYIGITRLPRLPLTLESLSCTGNPITTLKLNYLPNLKVLFIDIDTDKIDQAQLPQSLKTLYCFGDIDSITLPNNLIEFGCDNCKRIKNIPSTLKKLSLKGNVVTEIEHIPDNVCVYVSDSMYEKYMELHPNAVFY